LLAPARAESTDCELCGSRSARELYTATDRLRNSDIRFSVSICDGCGVLRTLPAMSSEELSKYYPCDYWGDSAEPSLAWIKSSQKEKTAFLEQCRLSDGKILDVGCGTGLFLRALEGEAWDRFGIETGAEAARRAAQILGDQRIFSAELIEARLESAAFDVITFWSALEHTNQPRSQVLEARRIIKPGGTIIVQVPNSASYQARIFKEDWFALDVPRHRYHFDLESLKRLLSDAGLEIYRTTYYSRAHNAHAFRQSLKTRLHAGSSRARWAAFCLTIPFIKPLDYLLTMLGGGATMTVAAKAV